jgi:hypothetical protein
MTAADLVRSYHDCFNTEAGKAVLADLKARTLYGESVFARGLEPWQPAYRDGSQSTIRHITQMLETPPNTDPTPKIKR